MNRKPQGDSEQPTDQSSLEKQKQSDFQVEFFGPTKKRSWILAVAVVLTTIILLASLISSSKVFNPWLPWTIEYAQKRVPQGPDGEPPIVLLELSQSQSEETITIKGRVKNQSEEQIKELIATLTLITALALPIVEDVPISPEELDAGAEGSFEWVKPLIGQAGGLKLKFGLGSGAIVQHKDERFEQTEKESESLENESLEKKF